MERSVVGGDERIYSTADEPDGTLMVRCGNRRDVLLAAGVEASLRAAREAMLDPRRAAPPRERETGLG